jgi:hypothetical protein
MARRFAKLIGIPIAGAWDAVFDETKEMTGRQSKYQHIADRTFLRPRDMIKFCNETLRSFRVNGSTSGDKFDNRNVADARVAYSEYLLAELRDEIHKHFPEYGAYFELIKKLESLQFEMSDVEAIFEARKELVPVGLTPVVLLARLFEFSIIGFYRPGGRGYGGSEYVFRYVDPSVRFDERAAQFRVHSGLMEVLGLKKWTKSG